MSCPKLNYTQKRNQRISWLLHLPTASIPVRLIYYFLTFLPVIALRALVLTANFIDAVKSFVRIPGLWPTSIKRLIEEDDKWVVLARRAKIDVQTQCVRQLKWTRFERLCLCIAWPCLLLFLVCCCRTTWFTLRYVVQVASNLTTVKDTL